MLSLNQRAEGSSGKMSPQNVPNYTQLHTRKMLGGNSRFRASEGPPPSFLNLFMVGWFFFFFFGSDLDFCLLRNTKCLRLSVVAQDCTHAGGGRDTEGWIWGKGTVAHLLLHWALLVFPNHPGGCCFKWLLPTEARKSLLSSQDSSPSFPNRKECVAFHKY